MQFPTPEIILDYPQDRITIDRIDLTATTGDAEPARFELPLPFGQKLGVELSLAEGVYRCPVTKTLMLAPLPEYDTWWTNNAGANAKLELANFTTSGGSHFTQHFVNGVPYLLADTVGRWAVTSATWPINQPFVVSFFMHGSGADASVGIEFGWNNSASGAAGVSVRLRATGVAEVWKDNVQVGQYEWAEGGQNKQSLANERHFVYLIPSRRTDLIVISSMGGGFVHTFEDVDPDAATPIVTAATNFWVYSATSTLEFCATPLKFQTAGNTFSPVLATLQQPTVGQTTAAAAFFDVPYYGTQNATAAIWESDKSGAFVPNGVKDEMRLRFQLTGDGNSTPFVYGAHGVFEPIVDHTPDDPTDITDLVTEIAWSVPESNEPTLQMTLVDLDSIAADRRLADQQGRPFKLEYAGISAFEGQTRPPTLLYGTIPENDEAQIQVTDESGYFLDYLYSGRFPLAGQPLNDALMLILEQAGWTGGFELEANGFSLPDAPLMAQGEWGESVEPGESAMQAIGRIMSTYAPTYLYGFKPTATGRVFFTVDPESKTALDAVTSLWDNVADARAYCIAQFGASADEARINAPRFVYQTGTRRERIAPEANIVQITGTDPRSGKPIIATRRDAASIDPTTAVASRPGNWLGVHKKYGLQQERLTSQASVDDAADLIFDRLSKERFTVTTQGRMIVRGDDWAVGDFVPVWKGDVIILENLGVYIVRSFRGRMFKEPEGIATESEQWFGQEFTYILEYVAPAPVSLIEEDTIIEEKSVIE